MIYILNHYGVSDKGHFWHQDFYFRKILRALGLRYVYLNTSAAIARTEDQENKNSNYRYETIVDSTNYVAEVITFLNKDILDNELKSVVLFFPWLPQFSRENLMQFAELESGTTITIAGISLRKQSSTWETKAQGEIFTHQILFESDPFKLLWIGEPVPRILKDFKQIRFLPEYAETKIKLNLVKRYDLSFHGQLASYRGLFEILVVSLFNPKLKVHIRGYSFAAHRVWRPVKFPIFRYTSWKENFIFSIFFSLFSLPISLLRFLPNVTFSLKPFLDESELDDALSLTRVVFFCSKLPHGSGLMTKSLSAGIPVIWNGLPGQASGFLQENYHEGKFNYWNIFVPGFFSRKISGITSPAPLQPKMWNRVLNEISELKKYI